MVSSLDARTGGPNDRSCGSMTPSAIATQPEIRGNSPLPPTLWLAVISLWIREIRSFYRQRSRVIGGLATPLVIWLLLSSGFSTSLQTGINSDAGSLSFFFPGALVLAVLFAAIFSNISVIEDRREGFLLSVLVAPVSRIALVLGKLLGASTIGTFQGMILLPLAPLAGISIEASRIPLLLVIILLLSFGLTGLGFFFAWWLNSVQGFHSVMNILLMPIWMLSGAVFPAEGASTWIQFVMVVNPVAYGVAAVRHFLGPGGVTGDPPFLLCLIVMTVFGAATLAAAFFRASQPSKETLG